MSNMKKVDYTLTTYTTSAPMHIYISPFCSHCGGVLPGQATMVVGARPCLCWHYVSPPFSIEPIPTAAEQRAKLIEETRATLSHAGKRYAITWDVCPWCET